jgi:hypothetical protein
LSYRFAQGIVKLKKEFVKSHVATSFVREAIPVSYSTLVPIQDKILSSLHDFMTNNPIYFEPEHIRISNISCRVYAGDINDYWLSSKKYDTNYQPFYPTWMLSAYALALGAKLLGFSEIVDIGSGDGRIGYCGKLVGLRSLGIEIDGQLANLQRKLSSLTNVSFEVVNADATSVDYDSLGLSRPIFFISGLPEWGEMLASSIIPHIMEIPKLRECSGFNFMGSHIMNNHSRDKTSWGWGEIIEMFELKIKKCITLPTCWTIDQKIDTAYVFTSIV